MSRTQKILLTIALAVILVFAYTVKVSAYDLTDLTSGTVTLYSGDTFEVDGTDGTLIGPSSDSNSIITLNSGTIEISADESYNLTITLDGNAVVNAGKLANLHNNSIGSLSIIITQGSTLTIDGTLVIPSTDGNNSITNNGTITINEGGTLEVRKQAGYTDNGTGKINVDGTLAIFGNKFTASSNNINLYENGRIYSYADSGLDEIINVAETNEEYNYSLDTATGTTYNSTASGSVTLENANLYTLSAVAVVDSSNDENNPSDDPVVNDPTTDESVTDDSEVVDETEDEVVDETVVDEESENPATGDEIAIFATIFAVAVVGLTTTLIVKKRLK